MDMIFVLTLHTLFSIVVAAMHTSSDGHTLYEPSHIHLAGEAADETSTDVDEEPSNPLENTHLHSLFDPCNQPLLLEADYATVPTAKLSEVTRTYLGLAYKPAIPPIPPPIV
ncbi:MAG: hypothetical protein ACI89Z_001295 [Porticoccus sp.]|jgi:hypothetical protein